MDCSFFETVHLANLRKKHWAFWCSPIPLQKIKFYWSTQPVGLPISFWLVVSSHLKNISQWEGLSHILWKNKKRFQTTNQVLLKYTTSWLTGWSWSACHGHCNHYCRWLWQGNRPAVDALKPTPVSNGPHITLYHRSQLMKVIDIKNTIIYIVIPSLLTLTAPIYVGPHADRRFTWCDGSGDHWVIEGGVHPKWAINRYNWDDLDSGCKLNNLWTRYLFIAGSATFKLLPFYQSLETSESCYSNPKIDRTNKKGCKLNLPYPLVN